MRIWSRSTGRFLGVMLLALLVQGIITHVVKVGIGLWLSPLSRSWMVLLQGVVAGLFGGMGFILVTTQMKLAESELILKLKAKLFSRLFGRA